MRDRRRRSRAPRRAGARQDTAAGGRTIRAGIETRSRAAARTQARNLSVCAIGLARDRRPSGRLPEPGSHGVPGTRIVSPSVVAAHCTRDCARPDARDLSPKPIRATHPHGRSVLPLHPETTRHGGPSGQQRAVGRVWAAPAAATGRGGRSGLPRPATGSRDRAEMAATGLLRQFLPPGVRLGAEWSQKPRKKCDVGRPRSKKL